MLRVMTAPYVLLRQSLHHAPLPTGRALRVPLVYLRPLSSASPADGSEKPSTEEPAAAAADGTESPGDAAAGAASEEVQALKQQLEEQAEQLNQRHEQLLRAVADADNIRKRTAIDVESAQKYAISGFAKSLLDVADNLERAIALVPEEVRTGEENPMMRSLYEGVKMTDDQLMKAFNEHGIERVDPAGEKFDPHFHEALYEVPDPTAEAGTVAQVQSVGYKLHERCLRSAKVGVVSKQK